MTDKYEQFKIKEYGQWDLFLHINQFPYIGRCYAWAKREDADLVTDMNPEETEELFQTIIPSWNRTVKNLFQSDRPNIAILGNEANHLHAHLIPRYNSVCEHYSIKFEDPNPKGNYAPYPKRKLDQTILFEIRDEIKSKI